MSLMQKSFTKLRVKKSLELRTGVLFGMGGVTPVTKQAAYTQTYSTAARTVATATASAVTTAGGTATSPFGYVTLAQANAIVTAINALIDDNLSDRKNTNAIIDDLQVFGFVA